MTDANATIQGLQRLLADHPAATSPLEHATIQFNLGLAVAESPHGDRDANLRQAIRHYAAALGGFDERFPTERARVLNALGAAERDLGLPVQARDRFIAALALTAAPAEAGAAANNLGLTLVDLGQPAAAVGAYDRALELFSAAGYGRQRAAARHNRGQAHAAVGNLEAAAADYRAAIDLVRPDEAPYVHGSAQLSLAVALLDTPGDRQQLVAEAVAALGAAGAVFTRSAYPFQHAVVKHNLGVAFEDLAGQDPTGLRRALVAYEDAVRLLDPRLHEAEWGEARAGLDRVEQRLAVVAGPSSRAQHFAALLGAVSAPELRELLRYRLRALLDLPGAPRDQALAELDCAVLGLEPAAASTVTVAWLGVLMEQPHDDLLAALRVRQAVMEELSGDAQPAAAAAIEAALGNLEIIQRVRVRDLLVEMGYERPDGS